MNGRRMIAALVLSSALLGSACSSSSSSGGGAPSGMPTSAAGLATLMQSAVAKAHSARFTLDVTLAGQPLTGTGVEKLSNGKLVALDVTERLPQGALRVILVDGQTYAKLPASMNSSGKPYLRVTKNSSNPVISTLAGSLDSALSSASLGNVGTFAKAAKSVKVVGPAKVGGVSTTHYTIVVDLSQLPADLPGKQQLIEGGLKTLPIDLYVDGQGRPIEVNEDFHAQGATVKTKVVVTAYDQPATITAPPAGQIGG